MRVAAGALRCAPRWKARCSRAEAAAAQAAAQAAAHRSRRSGAQCAPAAAAAAAFPPPPLRRAAATRSTAAAAAPWRAAAFSAAAAAPPDGEVHVQTPLCERPAEHEVRPTCAAARRHNQRSDSAARSPATRCGASEQLHRRRSTRWGAPRRLRVHVCVPCADSTHACRPAALEGDGIGASASELRHELTWLLDDAVSAARDAVDAPWRPAAWSAVARGGSAPPCALRLRAPLAALEALWRRRLAREPFQYLVAAAHWRDLLLAVGPGVLIPRPETETLLDLVEAALKQAPGLVHGAWADVGTGSGAIAVALARMLAADAPPVAATDISAAALAYAAANAARAGVADRVVPMRGEWLAPVLAARGPACLAGTHLVRLASLSSSCADASLWQVL